jgi:hypothetical protein
MLIAYPSRLMQISGLIEAFPGALGRAPLSSVKTDCYRRCGGWLRRATEGIADFSSRFRKALYNFIDYSGSKSKQSYSPLSAES